ncbi:MAG TPA: hypothetical protein DEB09_01455 [Candidatus Magasanikbacteria bacterium]|nr:hypothetical protein [Candidatus Magasanikbacteria bacterium]
MTEEIIEAQPNLYSAKEIKKVLQTSEIALWLEGYDDIFSDFDPSPYSQRALSDDFLLEAMKASRDRGKDSCELKFLLAPEARSHAHETVIKKRLHDYFIKQHHILEKERKDIVKKGFWLITSGIFFMLLGSFISAFYLGKHFIFNFLVVLIEPAGWFLFWEGLNHTIYESKKNKPNLTFYQKMAKSKITFLSY